jgi:hypothetical protein
MSDNIRITAEFKNSPSLRKLARALLMLVERQSSASRQVAEREVPHTDSGKESAA